MDVEKLSSVSCQVCGYPASSFHYGANACDACKIFFRRNFSKELKHSCSQEMADSLRIYDRSSKCSMCRLQKCLDAGMSLDDTRKGRYTYARKYRCIQRAKKLKSENISMILNYPNTVAKEIEHIANHITDLFLSCGTYERSFFEELPLIEDAFLEQKQAEAQVFGNLDLIPLTEYRKIFLATGIDVDNRQKALSRRYQSYTRRLETYITFAKKLNGFRELPCVDQVSLMKGARVVLVTVSESRAFNLEKGIYTFPEKFVYKMTEMCLQGRADYVETWFQLANKVEQMKLTSEEANILKCIGLFSSDNCVTAEGKSICDQQQQLMVKVLEYLLHQSKTTSQEASLAMAKCILLLADFRTLHEKDLLDYEFVSKEFPLVCFPNLLLDFYIHQP